MSLSPLPARARIVHLRAQLEQIEAHERDYARRCDTRRKIVLGGGLLARVRWADAAARAQCEAIIDALQPRARLPFNAWALPTLGSVGVAHHGHSRQRRRASRYRGSASCDSLMTIRITRLQAQLEQLEARDSEYERRRDTRRKILLGAGLLARVRDGDAAARAQVDAILAELPPHEHTLFAGWDFPTLPHNSPESCASDQVVAASHATPV